MIFITLARLISFLPNAHTYQIPPLINLTKQLSYHVLSINNRNHTADDVGAFNVEEHVTKWLPFSSICHE